MVVNVAVSNVEVVLNLWVVFTFWKKLISVIYMGLLKLILPPCEGKPQNVALDFGLFYQNIRHIDSQFIRMGPKDS